MTEIGRFNQRINREDFRDNRGVVDTTAFHKAIRENGEACNLCGIMLHRATVSGREDYCWNCRQLNTSAGTVHHTNLLRCPHCRASQTADLDAPLPQGKCRVECSCCEMPFEIEVEYTVEYASPPLSEQAIKTILDQAPPTPELPGSRGKR